MTLTGFAVCAHTFARINLYAFVVIPQVGIAMAMGFLLQIIIIMSWLRALSKGGRCWCCGPGRWCCELAERAFKTGAALVRRWCRCWCCQLASTGRGILPSYLGLCWCNYVCHVCCMTDIIFPWIAKLWGSYFKSQ